MRMLSQAEGTMRCEQPWSAMHKLSSGRTSMRSEGAFEEVNLVIVSFSLER